jgi:hypothetical protein
MLVPLSEDFVPFSVQRCLAWEASSSRDCERARIPLHLDEHFPRLRQLAQSWRLEIRRQNCRHDSVPVDSELR